MALTDEVTITVIDPPIFTYPTPTVLKVGVEMTPLVATVVSNPSGNTLDFANYTDLPEGLVIDSATGDITGIPVALGSTTTEIRCEENVALSYSSFDTSFIVSIDGRPKPEDPDAPPNYGIKYRNAYISMYNSATITPFIVGMTAPYVFSVVGGELNVGLELNDTNGVITGYPAETGVKQVSIECTDANLDTSTSKFQIFVTHDDVPAPIPPPWPDADPVDTQKDNFVVGDWESFPVLHIRPLTHVYLTIPKPVIAFGKARGPSVIAGNNGD